MHPTASEGREQIEQFGYFVVPKWVSEWVRHRQDGEGGKDAPEWFEHKFEIETLCGKVTIHFHYYFLPSIEENIIFSKLISFSVAVSPVFPLPIFIIPFPLFIHFLTVSWSTLVHCVKHLSGMHKGGRTRRSRTIIIAHPFSRGMKEHIARDADVSFFK